MLYSALNLIHPMCPEYIEALVEIAKCRRLLAVNKKHLRGQWRQDAIEVDEVNMQKLKEDDQKDRKDQLDEKGLEGEVKDMFIDYKEEALKTFVDLFEGKTLLPGDSAAEGEEEKSSDGGMTFQRIVNTMGENSMDNLLG